MQATTANGSPTLGFLTFVEFPQHGVVGGYLLLNSNARPIEFHCSAPVKANRAQEILYGPTLLPYLYGEQIARMLTAQSKQKPSLIFTDHRQAASVRPFTDCPVLVVFPLEAANAATGTEPESVPDADTFLLGDCHVAVASDFEQDRPLAIDQWERIASNWDLLEPFQRIREAIQEAQRAAA